MTGERGRAFNLDTLQGDRLSLEGLAGNSVVIHFGTSSRPFCNEEAPRLQVPADSSAGRGVGALEINVEEDKELVARWTGHRPRPWATLRLISASWL